jgi:hypothetical protein
MSKKRAKALLRVSTNAQDVARQRNNIRKLVREYDLEIVGEPLELVGVSGTTTLTNEQVQQVLAEVCTPGIDGLATSGVDRLARPQEGKHYSIVDGFKRERKTLWTVDEGELRVWTGEGFERTMNALTHAGTELRKIRQRSVDGKWTLRERGLNVNGLNVLPRGIGYERITDPATGRTIDGRWYYEEEAEQARKAYALLFEDRYQLAEIERRVGWGRGGICTLRRTAWKGIRVYPGTEDHPEPLEVAMAGLEPLLTPERWALAQALLAKRRTWSRETREQRFLAAGLLVCECGQPYYFHGDKRRGQHDEYYCATRHRGGKGCGATRLRRLAVDAAICDIVETHMTDARLLADAFGRQAIAPGPDPRAACEKELAKLERERNRWMDAYAEERIGKRHFDDRMDRINRRVREIERVMPLASPPPSLDARIVLAALVRIFGRFGKLPFLEQRDTLKRVVRRFPVVDRAIAGFALAGPFLAEVHTKPATPYSAW